MSDQEATNETLRIYQSSLSSLLKDVEKAAIILGINPSWSLILPVIAVKSKVMSKSTTFRYLTIIDSILDQQISLDIQTDTGWFEEGKNLEGFMSIKGSRQERIDKALNIMSNLLMDADITIERIEKAIGTKGKVREQGVNKRRRKTKSPNKEIVNIIEKRAGGKRLDWLKSFIYDGPTRDNIALLIKPAWLLGLRTSELFLADIFMVHPEWARSWMGQTQGKLYDLRDIEEEIQKGNYINVIPRITAAQNIHKILVERDSDALLKSIQAVKQYAAEYGIYMPPVMRVMTRKQGQTREDRKSTYRYFNLVGLDPDGMESLIYLGFLNMLLRHKEGASPENPDILDEGRLTFMSNRTSNAMGRMNVDLESMGYPKIDFMTFRHAFATRVKTHLSMEEASVLQGHVNKKTTSGYGKTYKRKKSSSAGDLKQGDWVPRADPARVEHLMQINLQNQENKADAGFNPPKP